MHYAYARDDAVRSVTSLHAGTRTRSLSSFYYRIFFPGEYIIDDLEDNVLEDTVHFLATCWLREHPL